MKKILLIAVLLTLTGCAAILDGSSQYLTVVPSNEKADNTTCVVENEEGKWTLIPSQSAEIERDGNTMNVTCENTLQKGSVNIEPEFHGAFIFLDILTDFCTIS